jgi:hypothetical protein
MSFQGARKIGRLLTPLTLRELGMPADVARLPEITGAWSDAVGANLAAHVQPVRYTGGKLILRASSPVWVSKVRHGHATLVRLLREVPFFRDLVGLEVRTAPAARTLKREPTRVQRELSKSTRRLLESVAAHTTDPGMRAALLRLARRPSRIP